MDPLSLTRLFSLAFFATTLAIPGVALAQPDQRPFPPGRHSVQRVVVGGEIREGQNMTARQVTPPFRGQHPNPAGTSSGFFPLNQYTLTLPFPDDSVQSWAEADQIARAVTYHPEQQLTSDALWMIPPDPVHGRQTTTGAWQSVDALPLDAFRPEKIDRLWIDGVPSREELERVHYLLDPLYSFEAAVHHSIHVADLLAHITFARLYAGRSLSELHGRALQILQVGEDETGGVVDLMSHARCEHRD